MRAVCCFFDDARVWTTTVRSLGSCSLQCCHFLLHRCYQVVWMGGFPLWVAYYSYSTACGKQSCGGCLGTGVTPNALSRRKCAICLLPTARGRGMIYDELKQRIVCRRVDLHPLESWPTRARLASWSRSLNRKPLHSRFSVRHMFALLVKYKDSSVSDFGKDSSK